MMRIVQLVPGSSQLFYCENCSRDGSLVRGLRSFGHEVLLAPLYLPLELEGSDMDEEQRIFYGAINIYLKQAFPPLRRSPVWIERLFDSSFFLNLAGRLSASTEAAGLGALTVSMLRGEQGDHTRELAKLIEWLKEVKPDIVHLSNGLLLGVVKSIKRAFDIPVVCSLQDEDVWIDGLEDEWRERTWSLMREGGAEIDLFLPVSRFYARFMGKRMDISDSRMKVIPIGVDLDGFERASQDRRILSVGYLSHISETMGFGLLVDAFLLLKKERRYRELRLIATGGNTKADAHFIASVIRRIESAGWKNDVKIQSSFDRLERIRFLQQLTLLSVPVLKGEAFGTFQIEAMAAGVPVVQPALGGFTEVVQSTGGGILYEPNEPEALASSLSALLANPRRRNQLAANGRDKVFREYSIELMVERLSLAFEQCSAKARKIR